MPAKLRAAFEILLEAHSYAEDAQKDIWQFAVETGTLRGVGLLPKDFRWLAAKEYVEHAREVTRPDDQQRSYDAERGLAQTDETCFILTDAGLTFALQRASIGVAPREGPSFQASRDEGGRLEQAVPIWDPVRRELRVGGRMVKRFRLPSRNQEMVLAAFEEEGWPKSPSRVRRCASVTWPKWWKTINR